jgi:glucose 1-dehydrogenase
MSTERLALVTGGAQGIGYACAEALKEDGYRRDPLRYRRRWRGRRRRSGWVPWRASPATWPMRRRAGDVRPDRGGARAGLGAGEQRGRRDAGRFPRLRPRGLRRGHRINLRGTFVATQRAAKTMVANGIKGAIVNMSSINAQLAIPAIPAYCASKGGVMQLTKVAALALAPKGIRVNAVGPGSIDTAMMAGVNANAEALKRVLSRTPLGRVGNRPRDRGRGRLPVLGEGQLHHRRDDLCRRRAAGAELHDVRGRCPPA